MHHLLLILSVLESFDWDSLVKLKESPCMM